jgi:antitoxin HicB
MNTTDYLKLPYHITLVREEDAEGAVAWVASVAELPGCISQGDTPEEAASMIREAMEAWIDVSLECGDPIPEPRRTDAYSGQFVLRIPSGLHQQLDLNARTEGVSLNQYVAAILAGAAEWTGDVRPSRSKRTVGTTPRPRLVRSR